MEPTPAEASGSALPSAGRVRAQRRLLAVAGGTYLAWWFVVQAVLPGSFNPLPGRLLVVAAFLATLLASFASAGLRDHLEDAFAACSCLLTAHYFWLLHRNDGDTPWAVGTYIVVVAVGACLASRRSLLLYSAFALTLGTTVAAMDPGLLHTIFLPGLATMVLLSNLTLHNRLLLEQERAGRARADLARATAEAGVELRDEFISVASHELRTPLTALLLSVQALSRAMHRAGAAPDVATLERTLENCQRQTTRLARLVEGLLDASQISSGAVALEREDVRLMEVVRDVARMHAADAERCGSPIQIDGDAAIGGRWDRIRLEQVVSNLLRNAILYGQGKPVQIDVRTEGGAARLSVVDHGIGIAPDQQERIFGRFERGVSARNYGGMGLGLYIARRIVEAHGGRVRVESKPGAGAKFIVELPQAGVH